jgi:putative membrane protein
MIKHFENVAVLAAVLSFPAGAAMAQVGPPWGGGGWWFHMFPSLLVLLLLAGLIFIVARVMGRRSPWRGRSESGLSPHTAALNVLSERFARGEIDKAEYEEKRRVITSA